MSSRLKKIFGPAFAFALVFAMVSAEKAVAQTEECPDSPITVTADTPKTEEAAMEAAEEGEDRPLYIQELIDCAGPGDTVQFADGTYEDVGVITIATDGNDPGNDEDDGPIEVITVRGNPGNPDTVKFTGAVQFNVSASNIVVDGLAFEETAAAEDGEPLGTRVLEMLTHNDTTDVCVGKNRAVRNSVFRNTSGDGIRVEGTAEAECVLDGLEITGNTFAGIGYNRDWVDGMGPRELGTGIPTIGSLNGNDGPNFSAIRFNVSHIHSGVRNVRISDNAIDGATSAGIEVQGVTGDDQENTADVIEVSYNRVRNVPSFGIRVREWGTTEARDYDLVVKGNHVTGANNSPWIVTSYNRHASANRSSRLMEVSGFGTARLIDRLLKPEIWSASEATSKIFNHDGAPVNIYENFGGVLDDQDPPQPAPTDGREPEYGADGARVDAAMSPIPQFEGGACAGTPCHSVVRALDPRAEGAMELDGITAKSVAITENELTGNTLGLVVCGGGDCYFNHPYSVFPYTTVYDGNAAFSGAGDNVDISMNNIYGNRASEEEGAPGESAIGESELENLPRNFATGDVYVSIGARDDKVNLDGNYLGSDPVLITDPTAESLERSGDDYDLAAEPFDLETGPREEMAPAAPMFMSAAVDGAALTLTFSEDLDAESVPAAGDFTVTVGGEARGVSEVSVSGSDVTLTLASAVMAGDEVTVSYTPGDNPIRDGDGLEAAAISDAQVTNNTGEPEPPMPPEDDDDGCALASRGSGIDLGMLLALAVAPFAFAACRRAKEAGQRTFP